MEITADDLLAGPRGRRVCLEVAQALLDPAIDEHLLLDWAIVEVGHALDPGSTVVFALGSQRGVPTGPVRPARPFTPADVVSGLARIDVVVPDALTVQQALVMSVDTARHWQDPDGTDLLAALPSVAAALRPFADAIVASAAGRWWTDPIALHSQVVVALDGSGVKPSALAVEPLAIRAHLAAWRAEQVAAEVKASADLDTDPTATVGGPRHGPHRDGRRSVVVRSAASPRVHCATAGR